MKLTELVAKAMEILITDLKMLQDWILMKTVSLLSSEWQELLG